MAHALVAFLLLSNMTISHGTLNGLIIYANVVSTSGMLTLNSCSITPLLTVFIAWINLDLGVETCFYLGMDVYQKTWLQFSFPFLCMDASDCDNNQQLLLHKSYESV